MTQNKNKYVAIIRMVSAVRCVPYLCTSISKVPH
uniref:Uncharacterized protein n=1 Tax=Rhizophora mucronata TaxID=61149 RepID=A0A2P2QZ16_RHIMU